MNSQMKVLFDIVAERTRQDEKFGDQSSNSNLVWLAILSEEVGEAAKEVVDIEFFKFKDPTSPSLEELDRLHEKARNLRTELIQTAAVAVAMIEVGDKMGWWPMEEE